MKLLRPCSNWRNSKSMKSKTEAQKLAKSTMSTSNYRTSWSQRYYLTRCSRTSTRRRLKLLELLVVKETSQTSTTFRQFSAAILRSLYFVRQLSLAQKSWLKDKNRWIEFLSWQFLQQKTMLCSSRNWLKMVILTSNFWTGSSWRPCIIISTMKRTGLSTKALTLVRPTTASRLLLR